MSNQHGLYKYVTLDTNEIIYIGKSNKNIKSRIDAHNRGKGIDEKFNAYKGNSEVYVAFLPNDVETDIMERALINKYKPVLNDLDNEKGFSGLISVVEPEWKKLSECIFTSSIKRPIPIPQIPRDKGIFLGTWTGGRSYYLCNQYDRKVDGRKTYFTMFADEDEAWYFMELLVKSCLKENVLQTEDYYFLKKDNINNALNSALIKLHNLGAFPCIHSSGDSFMVITHMKGLIHEDVITEVAIQTLAIRTFKEALFERKVKRYHGKKDLVDLRRDFLVELES